MFPCSFRLLTYWKLNQKCPPLAPACLSVSSFFQSPASLSKALFFLSNSPSSLMTSSTAGRWINVFFPKKMTVPHFETGFAENNEKPLLQVKKPSGGFLDCFLRGFLNLFGFSGFFRKKKNLPTPNLVRRLRLPSLCQHFHFPHSSSEENAHPSCPFSTVKPK